VGKHWSTSTCLHCIEGASHCPRKIGQLSMGLAAGRRSDQALGRRRADGELARRRGCHPPERVGPGKLHCRLDRAQPKLSFTPSGPRGLARSSTASLPSAMAKDARRDPSSHGIGGNIPGHHRTRTYNRPTAHGHSRQDDAPHAQVGAVSDDDGRKFDG